MVMNTDFEREKVNQKAGKRVLLVYPKFPITFWGMDYALRDLLPSGKYALPPLPLATLAAFLPTHWELRLVDENVRPIGDQDIEWADVVLASLMEVQNPAFQKLLTRAHALNKPVAVGGPAPTLRAQYYIEKGVDFIHVGEVGDATWELFNDLECCVKRPHSSKLYHVKHKLELTKFPPPRMDLIQVSDYLMLSLQFAVGCPFTCEFCEIPHIYGRTPRVKEPEQVLRELDQLYAIGHRGPVFFVDDNFIGNLPRVKALAPHIKAWQEKHGFPFRFSTEASVNLAEHAELLKEMQEFGFYSVFLGIETPRPEDLRAMGKSQNARRPLLESIRILQSFGLTIRAGMILGFETDDAFAWKRMAEFVEESAITQPMVNLLNAPYGSPLYARLEKEGLLIPDLDVGGFLMSNILYKQGQAEVFRQYILAWKTIYEPETFLRRIRNNFHLTGKGGAKASAHPQPLAYRLKIFAKMVWYMGLRSHYKTAFWKHLAWCGISKSRLQHSLYELLNAYHIICLREEIMKNPPQPVDVAPASKRVAAEKKFANTQS